MDQNKHYKYSLNNIFFVQQPPQHKIALGLLSIRFVRIDVHDFLQPINQYIVDHIQHKPENQIDVDQN